MAAEPKVVSPSFQQKPGRGKRERYAKDGSGDSTAYVDVASADSQVSDEDRERERRYTVLAATVDNDIRAAITARENSGIEQIWADDNDQYNGVDEFTLPSNVVKTRDQATRGSVKSDTRSKVFVPITKPKCDIGVARVSEMLIPNDDRPWDTQPTTIPDIDEAIASEDQSPVTLGDGTKAPAAAVAMMIKEAATKIAKAEADWIEDKFQEGSVYSELRQVLRDAGRIGTGVIKGPYPVERTIGKWTVSRMPTEAPTEPAANDPTKGKSGATVSSGKPLGAPNATFKRTTKVEPTSTCIRAEDCYPDPACGDSPHDGSFFVERAYWTGKKLKTLARLPGYDAKCIVECLKEGPMTYAKRPDNRSRPPIGDTSSESKLYEVYFYYGEATPEDLRLLMLRGNPDPADAKAANSASYQEGAGKDDAGVDDAAEPDPLSAVLSADDLLYLKSVPVVFTMVNGKPVKATLNPMETGSFPYDFFRWEPVKGQPWGRGIPRKMAIAQRIVNAAVRALLENAGVSAGPQIVITKGSITPAEGKAEVRGRKLWNFDPGDAQDPDVRKAFAVFEVQSTQQELSAIIQFGLDMADQLTNLPMLMQGDQQANTSPETLGGLKMLFNNAMSPLRVIAKGYDDDLISPHLKRYHDYGQQEGPDNIKGGDTQIVAKGSTALIQREEGREFLAQLFPVKDDPKLKIDPIKMIVEMARANGFDMKSIQYTDDEWKQKQAELAKNPPPQDPSVEAAQIRSKALVEAATINSQADAALQSAKAKDAALDRAHEAAMAQVDREIATMNEQGKRSDALVALKARLAESAQANRLKSDEMNLKLAPQNASGTGI